MKIFHRIIKPIRLLENKKTKCSLTHKKLQCNIVYQNVVQRDCAKFSTFYSQFHSIYFLDKDHSTLIGSIAKSDIAKQYHFKIIMQVIFPKPAFFIHQKVQQLLFTLNHQKVFRLISKARNVKPSFNILVCDNKIINGTQ